jgi:uncharacterized protein
VVIKLVLLLGMAAPVSWQPWGPALFKRAKAEKRFVLLDLHAVWCHWCHVMDADTYGAPKVRELLAAHYLAASVDQDAAPELAARYGDWGWPATVVFAPDGSEIVKRRGFIPPEPMVSLLRAIIEDPSPGPSVTGAPSEAIVPGDGRLAASDRARLEAAIDGAFDAENGGWGAGHKLVQPHETALDIRRALAGDPRARARLRLTLDGLERLIDPVWGGLYQYSDRDDWRSPHFERLAAIQAQGLEVFALAYAAFHDPRELQAARAIVRYLDGFLSAENGAFYTSQDADLSERVDGHAYARLGDDQRRALGIPSVDRHVYPRDNGLLIRALTELSMDTGDGAYLARARQAAEAMKQLARPDGSFAHGDEPALADTTAMGAAYLSLYEATALPSYLALARRTETALEAFRDPAGAGFYSTRSTGIGVGVLASPVRDIDENVLVARFCNALAHLTSDPHTAARASAALRYLTAAPIRERAPAAVWLATWEASRPPLHAVVVGPSTSDAVEGLLAAARAAPTSYKDIVAWDPAAPPPATGSPSVPPSPVGVAYVCGPTFCSPPAMTQDALRRAITAQLRK